MVLQARQLGEEKHLLPLCVAGGPQLRSFSFGFAAAATSVSAGGSGTGCGRKSAAAGDRGADAEQRGVAGDIAIQTLQLQQIIVTATNLASRLDRAALAFSAAGPPRAPSSRSDARSTTGRMLALRLAKSTVSLNEQSTEEC